jgi:hypothetical protein
MREVIQKWYDWLRQATSSEKRELAHVFSDGRQLWATDGYSLYARQVATGKQGHVMLDEAGLFQVSTNGGSGQAAANSLPDFVANLPCSQPAASVVVDRDKLLQALTGQDRYVRLTFFPDDLVVELSSAGAYALVMPITGMEEEDFWRPEVVVE